MARPADCMRRSSEAAEIEREAKDRRCNGDSGLSEKRSYVRRGSEESLS